MEHYDRDAHDTGTSEPFAREREHLVPMSALGASAVSDGDPDIRGWDVRTVSGRRLGAVGDLLVDAPSGEVVLIDVDLHETDRHTFVPIRVVRIDSARRVVMMDSADLPSANVARTRRDAGRRAIDVGTVRYPRADREVRAERPRIGDESTHRDDVSLCRRGRTRAPADRTSSHRPDEHRVLRPSTTRV